MAGGGVLSQFGSKYMLPIGTVREDKEARLTSVTPPDRLIRFGSAGL